MNKKKENIGKLMIVISAVVMIFMIIGYFSGSAVKSSGTKVGYSGSATKYSWEAEYEKIDGTFSKVIHPKENPQEIAISAETIEGSISITAECNGEILFEGQDLQSGHTHILAEGKVNITITAVDHKGSFSIVLADETHTH